MSGHVRRDIWQGETYRLMQSAGDVESLPLGEVPLEPFSGYHPVLDILREVSL